MVAMSIAKNCLYFKYDWCRSYFMLIILRYCQYQHWYIHRIISTRFFVYFFTNVIIYLKFTVPTFLSFTLINIGTAIVLVIILMFTTIMIDAIIIIMTIIINIINTDAIKSLSLVLRSHSHH